MSEQEIGIHNNKNTKNIFDSLANIVEIKDFMWVKSSAVNRNGDYIRVFLDAI